jgi:hypothetical protein
MLESLSGATPVDVPHPWFIAAAWVELGRKDQALDWLEKAYQDRIMFLVNLRRERAAGATFKPLWGEPRFEALLAKLNLRPARNPP